MNALINHFFGPHGLDNLLFEWWMGVIMALFSVICLDWTRRYQEGKEQLLLGLACLAWPVAFPYFGFLRLRRWVIRHWTKKSVVD